MVDYNALLGLMALRNVSKAEMAREIGIAKATFEKQVRNGNIGCAAAEKIIRRLDISNPAPIFFAQNVSCEETQTLDTIKRSITKGA